MKVTKIERDPGVWRLRIETGRDAEGNRLFKYETVHGSEDAANQRRFSILDQHEQGTYAAPDKMTVSGFFKQWLRARLALEKISRSTAENYETIFRAYIEPTLGGMRVQRVRGGDIQGLYTALTVERSASEQLKMSTVAHIDRIVAIIFKALRKARVITINPMEEVERPRAPKNRPKAQTAEVVETFLAGIVGHWLLWPANVLGLGSGLRRGEICGQRWKDVELDAARLHVWGQIVEYRDHSIEWRRPKTEKGLRAVSLPVEVVDMLRVMKTKAMRDRLAMGLGGTIEDAYVFTEDGVNPIQPSQLTRIHKYHCRRLGLPENFTFHGTRHTHITVLLRKVGKAGVKAVSERVGHADVMTTLREYDTVFETDDRALAEHASGIIGGGGKR